MNPLEFMLYYSIIGMCVSVLVMVYSQGSEMIFGAAELVFRSSAAVFGCWSLIVVVILFLA